VISYLLGVSKIILHIFELTTNGSHAGSQVLGEVCYRLVDVFLWQLNPDGLQSDFELINLLGHLLEFMALFQHGAQYVIVQWVQIWRVWGHVIYEPRTVCLVTCAV